MEIKSGVFGRIEQSFTLFKNNFVDFFLPIFIYNFISFLVFGVGFMLVVLSNIGGIDTTNFDIFTFLNNSKIVFSIVIGMTLLILYLILYIPVFLGLLKSIKQAIEGSEVTSKNNLLYGFNNLTNSFKTYWYIFAYVALIPAILFIFGGIFFSMSYFINGMGILNPIGLSLMGIALILFLVFSLYRGVKSSFALYSAINSDSFTKEDFTNSINITNGNWGRIVGNLFLVGLIIGIVSSIIYGILSLASLNSIDYSSFDNIEDIKKLVGNFSILSQSLSGFINTIINTIGSVFVIIFTYLFFLKLREGSVVVSQKVEEVDIVKQEGKI